jgi:hypothetical protein
MKKALSLSLIAILLFVSGCKKDKGDPPVLPPAESMTIDFSNFDVQTKGEVSKGTANSNWDFAAFAAGTFRLIIGSTLIVPVTAFHVAIDQTPTYVSDKNWQWTYNTTVASVTYKARLTALIRATDVEWKMYLTKEGAYTDFLWFEGTSKTDGTGGQWILYKSNAEPVKILQIDWTKTGSAMGTIRYTYIKAGDTFKDSYIDYGLTSNTTFNAFYKIHFFNTNASKFSDVDVEWNTTNHSGRIKCSDYLNGTWFCWDQSRINSVCQ